MNWKFWRWKREAGPKPVTQEEASLAMSVRAWDDKMIATGFRHWFSEPPPYGATLELTRREWPMIHVVDREQVAPEMNCYGLWWRVADGPLIHGTKILDLSLMAPRGNA